jgi:biopolymer transport protein ExbD
MPSAHQVRNKTRAAIRRREDQIEADELESGEINLIPYLDIVTNLMLFLLASITANILFGQINTQLPDSAAPQPSNVADPSATNEEKPLKLAVTVFKDELLLWSFSGLEGTYQQPKLRLSRIGRTGERCDSNAMCETNLCNAQRQCEDRGGMAITPVFNYRDLNDALYDIAKRHYVDGGPPRPRKADTYQAVLMADGSVPYGTLVAVIGAMRCKIPAFGQGLSQPCFLPTADENLKKAANPIDERARLYDTTRTNYDPAIQALFPDVIFSGGLR